MHAATTRTSRYRQQLLFRAGALLRVSRRTVKGRPQDYSGTAWEIQRMHNQLFGSTFRDWSELGIERMAAQIAEATQPILRGDEYAHQQLRNRFRTSLAYHKAIASQAQARRVTLHSLHVADSALPSLLQRVQYYFASANLGTVA